VRGAQIGLVNVAGRADGVQIGLVNVAREIHGLPLGLVSIAGNGTLQFDVWGGDVCPVNVSLRTGSRYVYTVLSLGVVTQGDAFRGQSGIGLGVRFPTENDKFAVNVDVTGGSIARSTGWNWDEFANGHFEAAAENSHFERDENAIVTVRLLAEWRPLRHLGLVAGPTGNALFVRRGDTAAVSFMPDTTGSSGDVDYRVWGGFAAGLTF
jgi:hypothetical protein